MTRFVLKTVGSSVLFTGSVIICLAHLVWWSEQLRARFQRRILSQ